MRRYAWQGVLVMAGLAAVSPCAAQPVQVRVVIANNVACRASASVSAPVAREYFIGERFAVRAEHSGVDGRWHLDSSRIPGGVAAGCWIRADLTADWSEPERALARAVERLLNRTDDVPFEDVVAVDNFLQHTPAGAHAPDRYLDRSALLQLKQLQLLDRAAQSTDTFREDLRAHPLKHAWFRSRQGTFIFFEPGNRWEVPAYSYWALFETHRRDPIAEEIAWAAANGTVSSDECDVDCQLQKITDTYGRYLHEYPHGKWVDQALAASTEMAVYAANGACTDVDNPRPQPEIARLRDALAQVTSPGVTPLLDALRDIEQQCGGPSHAPAGQVGWETSTVPPAAPSHALEPLLQAAFVAKNPNVTRTTVLELRSLTPSGGPYVLLGRGIRADRRFEGAFDDELFGVFVLDSDLTRIERTLDIFPTCRWADCIVSIEKVSRDEVVVVGAGSYGDATFRKVYALDEIE